MKKYLLFALAFLFSVSIYAQPPQNNVVLTGSTKTTIKATPHQIIDALKKRFPNAQSIQSYKTDAAAKGWLVSKEDDLHSDRTNVDRYTISFKNADFQYYALFEADGTMLREKYQQNNATLPQGAKAAMLKVGADDFYKGFKVVSKTYYKEVDYKTNKNYYELVVVNTHNSNIKKTITLDESGKQIKEVDM